MSLLAYLMITNYYLDVLKGVPYTTYSGIKITKNMAI